MMAPVAAWGRRKGGMVEGKEGSREGGERVGGRKEGREREWEEEGGWREGGERKQGMGVSSTFVTACLCQMRAETLAIFVYCW